LENAVAQLGGAVILTTGRLKLRTFLPGDLEPFAALNADPDVMEFLGGPLAQAQSDAVLRGAHQCFAKRGFGKIAVERIEDGMFLGTCGLSVEDWYPEDLEIGWRLARRFWGNGYAAEAAAAWLDYAFDKLGAPRVISITDVPNERSLAVMKRLGLRFDHEARLSESGETFDSVVYSLTPVEWRELPRRSGLTSDAHSAASVPAGQRPRSSPSQSPGALPRPKSA
jgi:RimJ/RimL family protein N-acetyltransferase